MSKAYIITAVDHGETCSGKARTLGVFFDRNEAQKVLDADMDDYKAMHPTYEEGELAVTDEDGVGREWNIEDMDVRIPLTPLQITNLNLLSFRIAHNEENFFSYENTLSSEEMDYLIDTLDLTYKILVLRKEGVLLEGDMRAKWIAEHGKGESNA